jgi:cytoskeletal protein CcmA (bactofilin family)
LENIMSKNSWVLGVVTLLSTLAAAQATGPEKQVAKQDFGTDHFVAGATARVDKAVAGDLIAAGGHVEIDTTVGGDAVVTGGIVRLDGSVGNGVYAAGGQVMINAAVGRNVRIGGGHVELGPKARVAGNATIAGGEVQIHGAVKGYLQAAGGRVLIDGPVDGNVVATSGHLELGPNARIAGKLRYTAQDLQRDPAAQVTGGVERFELPVNTYWREHRHRDGGWFWTAGLMLLAAILVGALPGYSARVTENFRTHPWLALALGFVGILFVPIAVIFLMITIIGLPLALLALLLYLALLLLGYVTTAVALSEAALKRLRADASARSNWRIGAAILAVLVLALLVRIPYLGGLVAFVAMFAGIGAIVLSLWPRPVQAG